ncbi:hypothetical protein IKF03_01255 [Candidatus Saccharibacteria bacterium]|nr:hypothetical protein [Candidatus Saccharibacteria bacterium]
MAAATLRKTRWTILLSLNAAAILIAGIAISSAIWFNGGLEFRVVGERSDIIDKPTEETELLESVSSSGEVTVEEINFTGNDDYISTSSHEFDNSDVSSSELWNETAITIYATPDIDICVGGGLSDLGEMYWQTSNPKVIAGFYDSARSWLGYDSETCRYPVIKGTGTTTITAGTYDGKRKDSIIVTVLNPPVKQWEHEVLTLVNKIRTKNNLGQLAWGAFCESAAETRAAETITLYSHTRPDGSSWSTVCPAPASGGVNGENLAIGNAAVSPATVVSLWMGSEAHRANILNPSYTKLAVGFVFDLNSNYRTHWSQFFSTY